MESAPSLFSDFSFSPLAYLLIMVVIPGIVETAKKFAVVKQGNRPLLLALFLGILLVGFAEAIALGLIPDSVLPWVRVVVMGLVGGLSVAGYHDLVKKFTGNGRG